jgi:hypothetical protein
MTDEKSAIADRSDRALDFGHGLNRGFLIPLPFFTLFAAANSRACEPCDRRDLPVPCQVQPGRFLA